MHELKKKKDLADAGFSDPQAEAMIELLREELATKEDLNRMRQAIDRDLRKLRNRLRWEIPTTTTVLLGLMLALFQYLG